MGKKIFLGGVNKVQGPRTLSAQSNLSQRDSNMQVRFYLNVVLEYWDVDIFGILHQLLWYIHSAPLYWTKYSLRARLLCTLIVHWPCKFIMLYKHTAARPRAKKLPHSFWTRQQSATQLGQLFRRGWSNLIQIEVQSN